MRRLRFSDDLLRSGLAYDEITGQMSMVDGQVHIEDRLVISGPSSLYQITGDLNLKDESIVGEMYLTLPVSNNIPWIGVVNREYSAGGWGLFIRSNLWRSSE